MTATALVGLLTRAMRRLEKQLRGHSDRRLKTTVDGAFVGEDAVNTVGGLPVRLFGLQLQPHMNATDDQHAALQFNLTQRFRYKTLVRCTDLTRFQRASKGTGKSAGCSRDNVV